MSIIKYERTKLHVSQWLIQVVLSFCLFTFAGYATESRILKQVHSQTEARVVYGTKKRCIAFQTFLVAPFRFKYFKGHGTYSLMILHYGCLLTTQFYNSTQKIFLFSRLPLSLMPITAPRSDAALTSITSRG